MFASSLFTLALALLPSVGAFSGKTCRIMPLGASITNGKGSSHGNGYRDDLYNSIAGDKNTVNMVGSKKSGDFHDPDNEGWTGAIIAEVHRRGQAAMPIQRPNIVTLLVGTNDMTKNIDVGGAPGRLRKLIQDILDWPWETMVVVSSLPPNANQAANSRINAFNAALPGLVKSFADSGRWVVYADCHSVVSTADLVDGTHPNDAAYARIAQVFYSAIKEGESRGWLAAVNGPPPKREIEDTPLNLLHRKHITKIANNL